MRNEPPVISQLVHIGPSPTPGTVTVSGYVTDFDSREMYGGPEHGGWTEYIGRDVFLDAVGRDPDVALMLNNAGAPLARTRTGTLKLVVDDVGFKIEAQVHAAAASRIRGGTLSYSLRAENQEWDAALENRVIHKISLHKCDINITRGT
jgi:phage head maturation protease